jgi:hypothetical protein
MLRLSKNTLLLTPCSGAKKPGSHACSARSILSDLGRPNAAKLKAARTALRERTHVDETLMPAYLRYSGQLYKHGSKSIGAAVAAGYRVLIVSGCYGLLSANEPIGWYEKEFHLRDWPFGLLEECLLDYARHVGIRSVIAVMARTSEYADLIRNVEWRRAVGSATLVAPIAHGGSGAQVTVPRAQGQAVAALFGGGLNRKWRSSPPDSLSLEIVDL